MKINLEEIIKLIEWYDGYFNESKPLYLKLKREKRKLEKQCQKKEIGL